MCGARGCLEKAGGSAQQNLWILPRVQSIPEVVESELLLAKYKQEHRPHLNPM